MLLGNEKLPNYPQNQPAGYLQNASNTITRHCTTQLKAIYKY